MSESDVPGWVAIVALIVGTLGLAIALGDLWMTYRRDRRKLLIKASRENHLQDPIIRFHVHNDGARPETVVAVGCLDATGKRFEWPVEQSVIEVGQNLDLDVPVDFFDEQWELGRMGRDPRAFATTFSGKSFESSLNHGAMKNIWARYSDEARAESGRK